MTSKVLVKFHYNWKNSTSAWIDFIFLNHLYFSTDRSVVEVRDISVQSSLVDSFFVRMRCYPHLRWYTFVILRWRWYFVYFWCGRRAVACFWISWRPIFVTRSKAIWGMVSKTYLRYPFVKAPPSLCGRKWKFVLPQTPFFIPKNTVLGYFYGSLV